MSTFGGKVLLGGVAALVLAAGSEAHANAPFLAKIGAERQVQLGPLTMDGRSVRVADVSCIGNGKIRIRVRGVFKYQHFTCLVSPAREAEFLIRFHSLSRGWTYEFIRFA